MTKPLVNPFEQAGVVLQHEPAGRVKYLLPPCHVITAQDINRVLGSEATGFGTKEGVVGEVTVLNGEWSVMYKDGRSELLPLDQPLGFAQVARFVPDVRFSDVFYGAAHNSQTSARAEMAKGISVRLREAFPEDERAGQVFMAVLDGRFSGSGVYRSVDGKESETYASLEDVVDNEKKFPLDPEKDYTLIVMFSQEGAVSSYDTFPGAHIHLRDREGKVVAHLRDFEGFHCTKGAAMRIDPEKWFVTCVGPEGRAAIRRVFTAEQDTGIGQAGGVDPYIKSGKVPIYPFPS